MQMTATTEVQAYAEDFKRRIHDMPVMGDPMAGPAYGQFEKSAGIGMIIGVVASVLTMGAALPMLASEVLATQIAGGIMFAGGALSGIGAITGNKKLSKIGGIMSLAGGIGGLASGALSGAGVGGAFAPGSGSQAVQSFASNMMESVNGVLGSTGLGYSDKTMAAAKSGLDGASTATAATDAASAPTLELQGADAASQNVTPLEPAVGTTTTPTSDSGLINNSLGTDPAAMKLDGVAAMGKDAAAVPGGDAAIPASGAADTAANPMATWKDASAGTNPGVSAPANKEVGILGKASGFIKDNSELLKVTMGALEKGAAFAMSPDQQATLEAQARAANANASFITSQQELLDYQKNNMSKQVSMISADDPDLSNKVKNAGAKGIPVVFIPSIGSGGVKQTGGAFNAGSANMAQTPVRQPTFNSATITA